MLRFNQGLTQIFEGKNYSIISLLNCIPSWNLGSWYSSVSVLQREKTDAVFSLDSRNSPSPDVSKQIQDERFAFFIPNRLNIFSLTWINTVRRSSSGPCTDHPQRLNANDIRTFSVLYCTYYCTEMYCTVLYCNVAECI